MGQGTESSPSETLQAHFHRLPLFHTPRPWIKNCLYSPGTTSHDKAGGQGLWDPHWTEQNWTEGCLLSTSLKTGFQFVTWLQLELYPNTFHELFLLSEIHGRPSSKPAWSLIFPGSPEFATPHLLDNCNCQNRAINCCVTYRMIAMLLY